MKKTLARIMVVAAMAFAAVGCSRETILPTEKGKILSPTGFSQDMKEAGVYTVWGRDRMIRIDGSTQNRTQPVKVRMADKLELGIGVTFRGRIKNDPKILNAMFKDIKLPADERITFDQVYAIYGQDVVARTTRDVLNKYNNEQFLTSQAELQKEVAEAVVLAMQTSPLEVSNITLTNPDLPGEITKAINKQAERELAIKTEENNQAVRLVEKTNEMALAVADQAVRIKRAETIKRENEITNAGLSPQLLEYRRIEAAETIAKVQAENDKATFVPYEALGAVGVSNKMFR